MLVNTNRIPIALGLLFILSMVNLDPLTVMLLPLRNTCHAVVPNNTLVFRDQFGCDETPNYKDYKCEVRSDEDQKRCNRLECGIP
jgi:hypothetical protein